MKTRSQVQTKKKKKMKKGANVRTITFVFCLFQKREWVTPFSRQERQTSVVSSTDPGGEIILREEDPSRFLRIVSLSQSSINKLRGGT